MTRSGKPNPKQGKSPKGGRSFLRYLFRKGGPSINPVAQEDVGLSDLVNVITAWKNAGNRDTLKNGTSSWG